MANTDMEKLEILINHWIEHNEEHAGEFEKWAERAKSAGNAAVHDHITDAIKKLLEANEHLSKALTKL